MKNIEEITIRPVTEADAEKLLASYAPYVTDTFITYEYTVPTVEEFRERIRNTLQAYPYFAAVENGRIIGYAYASAFHTAACRHRAHAPHVPDKPLLPQTRDTPFWDEMRRHKHSR